MTLALINMLRRRRSLLIASIALLASLAACSRQEPWTLDNITGLMPSLKFSLMNDAGQPVNAFDYRGKLVLLYFGYTHCPDVCPTTLATLARAIRDLGPDAARIRVLFVTVDPARDTAQVLKRYVAAFGPQFIGLRGDDDALESAAKRYRVAYSRERPDAQGDYTVAHSSAVFIFDGNGKPRLLATGSETSAAITQDLRRLLAQG
jgi:protein SCO1/2